MKISDYSDKNEFLNNVKAHILKDITRSLSKPATSKADAIANIFSFNMPDPILQLTVNQAIDLDNLSKSAVSNSVQKLPYYDQGDVRGWLKHCEMVVQGFNLSQLLSKIPTSVVTKIDEDELKKCKSYKERCTWGTTWWLVS